MGILRKENYRLCPFLSFFFFCFAFSGCAKETYKETIVSFAYPKRYSELDDNGTFRALLSPRKRK